MRTDFTPWRIISCLLRFSSAFGLPKAKNFNENYAKRLLSGKPAQPKLYFSFPPEFDVFNQILNTPPAKTVLHQPFDGPSPSDQIRFLDHDTMVENLADEILKNQK